MALSSACTRQYFAVVCTMPDSHIYVTALYFSTLVLHDGLFDL